MGNVTPYHAHEGIDCDCDISAAKKEHLNAVFKLCPHHEQLNNHVVIQPDQLCLCGTAVQYKDCVNRISAFW